MHFLIRISRKKPLINFEKEKKFSKIKPVKEGYFCETQSCMKVWVMARYAINKVSLAKKLNV